MVIAATQLANADLLHFIASQPDAMESSVKT